MTPPQKKSYLCRRQECHNAKPSKQIHHDDRQEVQWRCSLKWSLDRKVQFLLQHIRWLPLTLTGRCLVSLLYKSVIHLFWVRRSPFMAHFYAPTLVPGSCVERVSIKYRLTFVLYWIKHSNFNFYFFKQAFIDCSACGGFLSKCK